MTQYDYLQQNLAGFENDSFAKEKMKSIIQSNNIDTVIETGTYLGSTTKHFSEWADKVYTIEVNEVNHAKAKSAFEGIENIKLIQGNSAEKLGEVLLKLAPLKEGPIKMVKYKPVFLFLDAHWNDYNPLLAELHVISQFMVLPYIAIHDFKVPNRPDLGFDSYAGQDYDFEWIREGVERIYGKDGYNVEYNSEATGAKRGIIYLSPKHNG